MNISNEKLNWKDSFPFSFLYTAKQYFLLNVLLDAYFNFFMHGHFILGFDEKQSLAFCTCIVFIPVHYVKIIGSSIIFMKYINLLRMVGRFICHRCKGQERIILVTVANKEVTLMQMWVKSTHWQLL